MSRFTFNGKPIGYFREVMEASERRSADAVAVGLITQADAGAIRRGALGQDDPCSECDAGKEESP